jgi:hypothetical protein
MKNLIVHCPTKEECEAVQKKMFGDGGRFCNMKKILDIWWYFEGKTCLILEEGKRMSYAGEKFCLETYPNTPIITAEEYLKDMEQNNYCKKCGGIIGFQKSGALGEKFCSCKETMTKKLYIVVNKSKYKNDGKFKDIWISERKLDAEINLYKDQILIETTIDKIFEKGGLKEIEI